mmetsp:Transcript_24158/g.71883  ORF Transcript_24158/g.71883 Transcript_24158/m.71883 type:complete len:152 (+) Transcript_24158:3035-3490(+)
MVESRWATVTEVKRLCDMMSSSAACTTLSLALSSADVASSSSRMDGFLMIALAMAIRCFWPPESLPPPSPTCVPKPFARLRVMKPCAFAVRAAASISSRVASSLPSAIFSLTVPMKSIGSCPTSPICFRSALTFIVLTSMPSMSTSPESGS